MKKYYNFVWKETIRNPKNKSLIFLLFLCFFLVIFCLDLKKNFSRFLNDYQNNISFRSLSLRNGNYDDETIKKVKSIDHVIYVEQSIYSEQGFQTDSFKDFKMNGSIVFHAATKEIMPPIVFGREFLEYEKNVAICPTNFYPDSSLNDLTKFDATKRLTKEITLNKTFLIQYYNYKIIGIKAVKDQHFEDHFQIVGLYDNQSASMEMNECFVPITEMKKLVNNLYSNHPSQNNSSYMVIVDSKKNIPYVQEQLETLGFNSDIQSFLNQNFILAIEISLNVIIAMSFLAIFFLILLNLYKKVQMSQSRIAAQLAFGYTKKDIIKIQTYEIVTLLVISNLFSIFLYVMLYLGAKVIILNKIVVLGFSYQMFVEHILFLLLVTLVLGSILSYIFLSLKMKKHDILSLMNS